MEESREFELRGYKGKSYFDAPVVIIKVSFLMKIKCLWNDFKVWLDKKVKGI